MYPRFHIDGTYQLGGFLCYLTCIEFHLAFSTIAQDGTHGEGKMFLVGGKLELDTITHVATYSMI